MKYPDPRMNQILDRLENGIPGDLGVEERCRLFQHIVRNINQYAADNNLIVRDERGRPVAFESGYFGREDKILSQLAQTLEYSKAWTDFSIENAVKMGAIMADRHAYGERGRAFWRQLPEDRRISLCREFSAAQISLFKHDTFSPHPFDVTAKDIAGNTLAQFVFSIDIQAQNEKVEIDCSVLMRAPFEHVLLAMSHETAHATHFRLAYAFAKKALPPYNPFYADARLAHARVSTWAYTNSMLPLTYAADPEEALANQTAQAFVESWSRHSQPQPRRFSVQSLLHGLRFW